MVDEPPSPGGGLTDAEREVWFAWKRAHDVVRSRIADEVASATGLSDADTGILIRLDEAGGALRQSVLASQLGWDRTRLSHQLTRMGSRGLLERTKTTGGVHVALTSEGRSAIAAARPVHAAAVRRHLLGPAGPRLGGLHRVLERLAAREDSEQVPGSVTPDER